MQKIYLDSNIFIYYSDKNSVYWEKVNKFFIDVANRKFKVFISPLMINECVYVFWKKIGLSLYEGKPIKVLKKKFKTDTIFQKKFQKCMSKFNSLIQGFVSLRNVKTIDFRFADILSYFKTYQNLTLSSTDSMHAAIMKNHKIKTIATFDKDFLEVDGIEVYDFEDL